jgi:hypothetical protein
MYMLPSLPYATSLRLSRTTQSVGVIVTPGFHFNRTRFCSASDLPARWSGTEISYRRTRLARAQQDSVTAKCLPIQLRGPPEKPKTM